MNQHPFVVFMKGLRDAPPESRPWRYVDRAWTRG